MAKRRFLAVCLVLASAAAFSAAYAQQKGLHAPPVAPPAPVLTPAVPVAPSIDLRPVAPVILPPTVAYSPDPPAPAAVVPPPAPEFSDLCEASPRPAWCEDPAKPNLTDNN
jgi:hypothetical protein